MKSKSGLFLAQDRNKYFVLSEKVSRPKNSAKGFFFTLIESVEKSSQSACVLAAFNCFLISSADGMATLDSPLKVALLVLLALFI